MFMNKAAPPNHKRTVNMLRFMLLIETSNSSLKTPHQASHTSRGVGSIKRHTQQRHPPFLVGAIPLVAPRLLEGPNDIEWLWAQFLGTKMRIFGRQVTSHLETNGRSWIWRIWMDMEQEVVPPLMHSKHHSPKPPCKGPRKRPDPSQRYLLASEKLSGGAKDF